MREILFRGKRLDNGEWVYGYYVGDCGDGVNEIVDTDATFAPRVEVDPATVGQYTGLVDSYRRKVFEGDILRFADQECEWVGRVEFGNPNGVYNWGFQLVYISWSKWPICTQNRRAWPNSRS